MPLPKRKNDINVYPFHNGNEMSVGKQPTNRRQELLDQITKNDSFLPDDVLHDDLDAGMLDFVKKNFVVISDNQQIPVINKILTVQRWAEFANNWEFADGDNNIKLPFISVVRQPDVQPGTNPITLYTIPNRSNFHYATVKTWNGSQMGADVYKIPQPVAVDISFDVTIVCNKFRDLNKLNKVVLQKFSSKQSYTIIKGHYIPIILDSVEDNSPIDTLDGRRFYLQTYKFTMLGLLIDSEEFEVKPAISRVFLTNEFIIPKNFEKKFVNKNIDVIVASFLADGLQKVFSVGESIGELFSVSVNGLVQERDIDYFHIAKTSKITFVEAPYANAPVGVKYYRGKESIFIDVYGKPLNIANEKFIYDGSTLVFTPKNSINEVVVLDINGLIEEENVGFTISGDQEFTLLGVPAVGSSIGLIYLY